MTCGVAGYHVISCYAMHYQVLLSSYLVKFHNDPSDAPSLRNGTKPSAMGERNMRSKELQCQLRNSMGHNICARH